MAKEIENADGTKETVFTQEDIATQSATAVEAALKPLQGELEELKRINAARGTDFTAYSKMSEEQKKSYDANTTELLKREETLVGEITSLKTTISEKETNEKNATRNMTLKNIHLDDPASKEKVEKAYAALAGMPEGTQQEIHARAIAAAAVAGIVINPQNPLYTSVNGEAPTQKNKGDYTESDNGKVAADLVRSAMGIQAPK